MSTRSIRATRRMSLAILAAAALALALSGPVPAYAAAGAPDAVLEIGDVGGAALGESVTVPVTITTNGYEPATVVFFLLFDPAKLAFQHAALGPAVQDPGAGLTADDSVPGQVGFALFVFPQTDEPPIVDGLLLTAVFEVLSVPGEPPSFAGARLTVASEEAEYIPAVITGNCGAPEPPSGLSASSNRTDGILVSWSAAQTAASYRVYRNTGPEVDGAKPVSEWIAKTAFLDATALPSTPGQGCAGPQALTYWYWVSAKDAEGCASALGGPVQGTRLEAATKSATARFAAAGPLSSHKRGKTTLALTAAVVAAVLGSRRAHPQR